MKMSITSDDDKHLKVALSILEIPKIAAYKVCEKTLFIYSNRKEGRENIPFPSRKVEFIQSFIKCWLESIEYPREPDHDGSNVRGFDVSVYTMGYCDIVDEYAEIDNKLDGWDVCITVRPIWIEYHK